MSRSDWRPSLAQLRSSTVAGLRAREEEIHEAVIHRTLSVAPPTGSEAPGYVEALRAAIPSAIDHALEAIEVGEERLAPTPAPILVQAAAAARSNVGLEAVMRRYAAGYSTMCDFLYQEVQALGDNSIEGFTVLQRELTAVFDSLVVEVSAAYEREERRSVPSPRQRELERVRRLLAGELIDPQGLDYPLGGHHLAVIIAGAEPEAAASGLAARLDRRLLVGESGVGSCAVWLGGSRPLEPGELSSALRAGVAGDVRLAVGEPGAAVAGWRRTRRQAEAAYLVAGRTCADLVRYRDVALVAAALRDPDLAHFLTEAYVKPLGDDRSQLGPMILTLIEMNGNASSTGAALGISRQTVAGRMRAVEKKLGRSLGSCAGDLQAALRLAELGA